MVSKKGVDATSKSRSNFARHVDRLIMKSGKQQNVIAQEMGYDRPNIISMFKHGLSRVPLDKVPALAASVGVDPASLITTWLSEYEPGLLKVLEDNMTPNLSEEERQWVAALRRMFPNGAPTPDERHEGVMKDLVAVEQARWDALDRDEALPATARTTGAGSGAATGAGTPLDATAASTPTADADTPAPPPARPYDPEDNSVLSHRFREASLMAIARAAKARGMTQKQLLSFALTSIGVELHPADMGVRAPARRRMDEF